MIEASPTCRVPDQFESFVAGEDVGGPDPGDGAVPEVRGGTGGQGESQPQHYQQPRHTRHCDLEISLCVSPTILSLDV